MFGLIGAIWRGVTTVFKILTFQVDFKTDRLKRNPDYVKGEYKRIIEEKSNSIQRYKGAVELIVAQQEKGKTDLRGLDSQIRECEQNVRGALVLAQERVAKLKKGNPNMTDEEVMADVEVQEVQSQHTQYSDELEDLKASRQSTEQLIAQLQGQIDTHVIQLKSLKREIDQLNTEAATAVAEIISAKEQKDLTDMLSNLSGNDSTGDSLNELRDIRREARAGVQVAQTLAGTDAQFQKNRLRAAAQRGAGNSQFASLLGLQTKAPQNVQVEKPEAQKLPD